MKIRGLEGVINGHLEIKIAEIEDNDDGKIHKWNEIFIHGDPEGLRSLAKVILELANLDQENLPDDELPVGGREHEHLRPHWELSENSDEAIVGRLDAKGTGIFPKAYVQRTKR